MSTPKRILFLDPCAPKPYDSLTLDTEAQGGTESTVTRIAEGLAARGHSVVVAQACRKEETAGRVHYVPLLDGASPFRPEIVIGLRKADWNWHLYPDAKRFIWLHDFNQNELVSNYEKHLKGSGVKLICVSRTHKTIVADALLKRLGRVEGVTVSFIYNPIGDDLFGGSSGD
jgi:hypothetical protein